MFNQHIISLIKQAQQRQANVLELDYDNCLTELDIAALEKPSFNTRKLVESQVSLLADSLAAYGFLGGIYVNQDTKEVIDGWHRLELWRQLGHTTIPAFLLGFGNVTQPREAHLRLNQVMAVFAPEEFGLEFDNINLLEFGFAESTLSLQERATPASKRFKHVTKQPGFTKFSTSILNSQYERLKAFKTKHMLADWADVIDLLIETYENHESH